MGQSNQRTRAGKTSAGTEGPGFRIREMTVQDYGSAMALWRECPGMGLCEDDSPESIAVFLARNPGLSFLAEEAGVLVGTVLCGHDGRRASLYHLAVRPECRRAGLGSTLVDRCLHALGELSIRRCNLFVYADNGDGIAFWERTGWSHRRHALSMYRDIPAREDRTDARAGQ